MAGAKDIRVEPIACADARRIVAALHYSHRWVNNSQLHFGVFLGGRCGGAMQFGPPMCRENLIGLVSGTPWNGFLELNRMAFADWLPRNSESRALGVALRFIRKRYPWIQWIVSFADGCQCGDGTIYRAAGFVLTGIQEGQMFRLPPDLARLNKGPIAHRLKLQDKTSLVSREVLRRTRGRCLGTAGCEGRLGLRRLEGYMLRYLYFLDPSARGRLTVPILPFSEIARRGAGMYRGRRRAGIIGDDAPAHQAGEGGSTPTPALQSAGPSAGRRRLHAV